ncbi:MAG: PAC2 family protein [Anaerolineae bacterium]|nr:PAC2 family protein [Anaerolineae bacterium]
MEELISLWEKPVAKEIYMIAGWHQWADAGEISSGLPQYLIKRTRAEKIGVMHSNAGYYLFQVPGTHHFLRPQVKLKDGYRQSMPANRNEFYYAGNDEKGLVIFLGEEPHINVERYAEVFFEAVGELGVKRVAIVGGVYGAMPYEKEREISCIYSLPKMKDELAEYAVKFSSYEGGATIGSYLADRAEQYEVELLVFYGFVPAYDFSQFSELVPGIRIERDFKAWYDLMKRFNHMFGLDFDLSDLEQQCQELVASMDAKLDALDDQMPQLEIKAYLDKLTEEFNERHFIPLDDVWRKGLEDIFKDVDDW